MQHCVFTGLRQNCNLCKDRLLEQLLNDENIEEWQIAAVFMLAAGKNTTETRRLLARMSRLSEAAIHTRFCRYSPALRPPPQE